MAVVYSEAADAQSIPHEWTPPLNLFETEGRASEAEVVADPFGAVHVFWAYGAPGAEEDGESEAIFYARKEEGAWTEPIDVLISPGGRVARMHSAAVDGDGYLHLVWSGGDALFYSQAYASDAGTAQGWSSPYALISGVGALEPAIAVAPDDTIYVVWSQPNAGLIFVRSDDSGRSWATPEVIYQADRNNQLARWGRLAVDETGRIHMAFTYTVNDPAAQYGRTDAMLLYYFHSDDRGVNWSVPFLVTPEPDFGEMNVAAFGENMVHLVWNGRAGRHGRYHRWSQDGGETWSTIVEILAPAPQNPIGNGGLTGFPALAADATGALHMVSATGGGDYYFRWSEGAWSSPVLISSGLDGNGVTGMNNSLEQPSIAISQGNQLNAVFHDGFERIWYTGASIDAPLKTPVAPPTREAAPTIAPTASPIVLATETATPVPQMTLDTQPAPTPLSSSFAPILAGVLPAILLIGVAMLVHGRRRSR